MPVVGFEKSWAIIVVSLSTEVSSCSLAYEIPVLVLLPILDLIFCVQNTYCRWHGMNQNYYKVLNVSAHGWLNWCQTCQPSICHPSHHQGKSHGFHSSLIFPSTVNSQCRHFPATLLGLAVPRVIYLTTPLQAYREPGILLCFTCFCPLVFRGLITLPHPPESPLTLPGPLPSLIMLLVCWLSGILHNIEGN